MGSSSNITYKIFNKLEAQNHLEQYRDIHYNPLRDISEDPPKSSKPPIADLHERLRYIDRVELWKTHYDTPDPMFYHVALHDNLIVGWASLHSSPYEDNTYWLQGVSVDPKYRKQGIAKQLVKSIAKQAVLNKTKIEVSTFTYLGDKFLKPTIESTFSRIPNLKYVFSPDLPHPVCENDIKEATLMGYTSKEIEEYKVKYSKPHKLFSPDFPR